MSELARVWRIYIDEATKFDSSLTEGSNRAIDVLLVFVSSFKIYSHSLFTDVISDWSFLSCLNHIHYTVIPTSDS